MSSYVSGHAELRDLIRSKGYNQTQIAHILEIVPPTMTRKMRGDLTFKFPERLTMAFILEVEPDLINQICSKIRTEYLREKGMIE